MATEVERLLTDSARLQEVLRRGDLEVLNSQGTVGGQGAPRLTTFCRAAYASGPLKLYLSDVQFRQEV